jgi:hypothetical protein
MLGRFEPVASTHLSRIHRDENYKFHMGRVSHTLAAINTTQPELSPRHRLLASRAAKSHRDFLKTTRAKLRTVTQTAQLPYSDLPPTRDCRRVGFEVEAADPYGVFRSPISFIAFSSLGTHRLPATSAVEDVLDSDDSLLEVELSDDEPD